MYVTFAVNFQAFCSKLVAINGVQCSSYIRGDGLFKITAYTMTSGNVI